MSEEKNDLGVPLAERSKIVTVTREMMKEIGWQEHDGFTVSKSLTFDLGRDRYLSAGCVATPNEMIFLCQRNRLLGNVTDAICLHNYDYDGYLTHQRLRYLMGLSGIAEARDRAEAEIPQRGTSEELQPQTDGDEGAGSPKPQS